MATRRAQDNPVESVGRADFQHVLSSREQVQPALAHRDLRQLTEE